MECKQIEVLLIDYADGKLTPEQVQEVEKHLESCASCRKELENTRFLMKELGSVEEELPPATLRERFLEELEQAKAEEKQKTRSITIGLQPMRIAASVALLICGFLAGMLTFNNSRQEALMAAEIHQLKGQVVASKLYTPNASERLQAINMVSGTVQPAGDLMEALVNTMNSDENVNVRLAAITALSEFKDDAFVRSQLIASLDQQDNPLLQIALIQILTETGDKEAGKKIKALSEDEQVDEIVKEQARQASQVFM